MLGADGRVQRVLGYFATVSPCSTSGGSINERGVVVGGSTG